jgi:hypothetical protein
MLVCEKSKRLSLPNLMLHLRPLKQFEAIPYQITWQTGITLFVTHHTIAAAPP